MVFSTHQKVLSVQQRRFNLVYNCTSFCALVTKVVDSFSDRSSFVQYYVRRTE